jgi:hypothetical protein
MKQNRVELRTSSGTRQLDILSAHSLVPALRVKRDRQGRKEEQWWESKCDGVS